MLKQNNKLFNDKIRSTGCNFCSLLAGVERIVKQNLSVKQIEDIYNDAIIKDYMTASCWAQSPHLVAQLALRTLGDRRACLQIGSYDLALGRWQDWVGSPISGANDDNHFAVAHWATTVNPKDGHFCLADVKLNQIFDPWDAELGGDLGKIKIDRAYLYKIV